MADEQLNQQFIEWSECLQGSRLPEVDPNSVMGVIETLFWEMAAYEAYVEICQNDPQHQLATLLFGNLTAFNYIQVQAIRIRRLCEPPVASDGTKDTSVYSLHRVVDGLKKLRKAGALNCSGLCTIYGIPVTRETNITEDNFVAEAINGQAYKTIDHICDSNGVVKKNLIDEMNKRLLIDQNVQLREIIQFVDKKVVHSASEASRSQLGQELVLRVSDMKKVIQGITELYFCCMMLITRSGDGDVIAVGWQDQLRNLGTEDISRVHEVYGRIEQECQTWKNNGFALLGL